MSCLNRVNPAVIAVIQWLRPLLSRITSYGGVICPVPTSSSSPLFGFSARRSSYLSEADVESLKPFFSLPDEQSLSDRDLEKVSPIKAR